MGRLEPRLIDAQHAGGYCIRLTFDDGASGVVDFEQELWGAVFEPLRDPERFKAFSLDEELKTVVWPNGADLAPEYLYQRVTG